MAPTYVSTTITEGTRFLNGKRKGRAHTVYVVGKTRASQKLLTCTHLYHKLLPMPFQTVYTIPPSLNVNERNLIHVSVKGAVVASTSDCFLSSLVKPICASIPAIRSLPSLVLALASDQGHTTLLWLIKVPTPHFFLLMVCWCLHI